MKFRKKPVVIEAAQFYAARQLPFHNEGVCCYEDGRWYVQTLEGPLNISEGDWIIRGVKGEFYPCKPDVFAATYEPADPPAGDGAPASSEPIERLQDAAEYFEAPCAKDKRKRGLGSLLLEAADALSETAAALPASSVSQVVPEGWKPCQWPDPTPEMLSDPQFEAIWQCIKHWDINVPAAYQGYSSATGNHVRAIMDALSASSSTPTVDGAPASSEPTISANELRKIADVLDNTVYWTLPPDVAGISSCRAARGVVRQAAELFRKWATLSAAAAAPAPGQGWLPIETAPKDGTRVLLLIDDTVLIGRWSETANAERFQQWPGWQIFDCDDGAYSWAEPDADGWQPLPPPPSETPA